MTIESSMQNRKLKIPLNLLLDDHLYFISVYNKIYSATFCNREIRIACSSCKRDATKGIFSSDGGTSQSVIAVNRGLQDDDITVIDGAARIAA